VEGFVSFLLKIVSIAMLVLFVASVILLVLTFRKPKKVSIPSIALTIIISLVTLLVFSSITAYEPSFWMWLPMVAIGATIGWYWARTTRLFVKESRVYSQNSVLYLVVWGAIFAFSQLITIATNRPPGLAMALLIVSTATVWGTNSNIIKRYFGMKTSLQPIEPSNSVPPKGLDGVEKSGEAGGASHCPACGAQVLKDTNSCVKCGGKL
jgi:hypothetical protein